MSELLNINNKYFAKGFFYWFGIEENPMAKRVNRSINTEPHILIKEDLMRVKMNYRKSYNKLKSEILEIG